MKVEINDAVLYGQWNSNVDEFPSDSVWLEKSSGQFFATDNLIDDFGYESYDDIAQSGFFIPVFRADILELEKNFLINGKYTEESNSILAIIGENNCSFDVAFKIFSEQNERFDYGWESYLKNALVNCAEKWCKENDLELYSDYDPERKFVVDGGVLMFAETYGEDSPKYWLSKKNFSLTDDMMVVSAEECIEFVSVDMYKLESHFVTSHPEIVPPVAIEYSSDNEDAFYDWCSQNGFDDEWDNFKKNQLLALVIDWCIRNNIAYIVPTGNPEHYGKLTLLQGDCM